MANPRFFPRIVAALLTTLTACAPTAFTTTAPALSPFAAAVDTTAKRFFGLGASPGVGVVVVRDTGVLYMRGFGYADAEQRRAFTPESQFYIASTTKSFTGLAAAILALNGRWSLDDPLSRFLPDLKLQTPMSADSITIRSLLTHTHGIENSGPVVIRLAYTGQYDGDRELIALLASHGPARTGRAYAYGNIGYNVAGLAMDAMTGESWKETLRKTLFEPLGMKSTTAYVTQVQRDRMALPYRLTANGFAPAYFGKTDANMQSAGGLFSTLSDMSKWLEAHINDGRLDGRQVLPAAAVRQSHQLLATTDQNGRGMKQIGYGLGWQITVRGADTVLIHGGGFPGYATHMSFMPKSKLGVVVMANNSDLGGGLVDLLAFAIYDALQSGKAVDTATIAQISQQMGTMKGRVNADQARRAARPQTLPFPLDAYTGSFVNKLYGTMNVVARGGHLEANIGAARTAVEVYDAMKNQLRVEFFGNGEVANVTMENGKVSAISVGGMDFKRVP